MRIHAGDSYIVCCISGSGKFPRGLVTASITQTDGSSWGWRLESASRDGGLFSPCAAVAFAHAKERANGMVQSYLAGPPAHRAPPPLSSRSPPLETGARNPTPSSMSCASVGVKRSPATGRRSPSPTRESAHAPRPTPRVPVSSVGVALIHAGDGARVDHAHSRMALCRNKHCLMST